MKPGEFLTVIWLLPTLVAPGVVPRIDQDQEFSSPVCQTYTLNGLRHVDCSNRGLADDLPSNLEYEAEVLVLSNNNFRNFPPQIESFHDLQVLNLSSNYISQVIPEYFKSLERLTKLDLSDNVYESWQGHDFDLTIETLDLSKNKINTILQDAFKHTPRLHSLDLSENRIYDLPSTIFSEAKNLDTLILSRNYFSDVPSFQSHSLKRVFLSNCQIMNIEVNTLKKMNSLLKIDLSLNQIEEIPDNFASNTLQELNLGYNEISIITDSTFSSLPHLAVLDLRGNEFRDVWSSSYFSSNPFLREMYVKGNRWSCEGFSVNLLLTYEFFTKDPPKIMDTASLICYSPSNVTQLSWQEAYIRTWHPLDSVTESYTTIAVLVGVIIGIVMTSMVCRALMSLNKPEPSRPPELPVNQNGTMQPRVESVIMRIPLHDEDQPPTYDEALLMPRLNSSFHSLPDFIDEDEPGSSRRFRRSRSFGDITEYRPRTVDRRSVRRTVEIRIE